MDVWLELSRDKYKLPVAVAGSASELARITGANIVTIRSTAYKSARENKERKYIRVVVEDD